MLSLSVPSLVSDNAPISEVILCVYVFFFFLSAIWRLFFFFKKDKIVNQSRMIKPRFLLLRDFDTFKMS